MTAPPTTLTANNNQLAARSVVAVGDARSGAAFLRFARLLMLVPDRSDAATVLDHTHPEPVGQGSTTTGCRITPAGCLPS